MNIIYALFYSQATTYGRTNVMSALINAGANLNAIDLNGYTALIIGKLRFF